MNGFKDLHRKQNYPLLTKEGTKGWSINKFFILITFSQRDCQRVCEGIYGRYFKYDGHLQ